MSKSVVINCFPECVDAYKERHAIVAVDVIRATTTAVTCAALGRRCFPVPSVEAATSLAARLKDPLLVGEVGGDMPPGFHMNNSPADLELRQDVDRPVILLSTSGTRLICAAEGAPAVYAACLRNYSAMAAHLAENWPTVAVIGAGSLDEFREEDQLCCAWIAERLVALGYEPEDSMTSEIIRRWSSARVDMIAIGASASYLRRSRQVRDLKYILSHVDDLDAVYRIEDGELVQQIARSLAA
jgi:2-phosphosulfolactate phosphatase